MTDSPTTQVRQETRFWITGIVISALLILGGCVLLYFAGHMGRYGSPGYGFTALVMIIIGALGECMCISLLREFNKYRKPRLLQQQIK